MATLKSTPPLPYSPRSHIHIFISTLHLLDLPRQPTYPDITITTFSTTSTLQQRIKATEWTLYHLFQLYYQHLQSTSPATPSQMHLLTPTFSFPPKTPLHSLTLRSGFYKILTDMKRTAVLPKTITLRKTMFDECKGEKFDEVLAAFAMVVLRRVVMSSTEKDKDKEYRPLSTSSLNIKTVSTATATSTSTSKMMRPPAMKSKPSSHIKKPTSSSFPSSSSSSTTTTITAPLNPPKPDLPIPSIPISALHSPPTITTPTNPDHIIPLLLAHRFILQRNLNHRNQLTQQAQTYTSYFTARENKLTHQLKDLETQTQTHSHPSSSSDNSSSSPITLDTHTNLADVYEKVMRVFATTPEWGRYLLDGEYADEDTTNEPNEGQGQGKGEIKDQVDRFRLENDNLTSSSFPILRPPESMLEILGRDEPARQQHQHHQKQMSQHKGSEMSRVANLKNRLREQQERIQALLRIVNGFQDDSSQEEEKAGHGRDTARVDTAQSTTSTRYVAQPRFTRHLSIRV